MTYFEMNQVYGHIPQNTLREILQKELTLKQWTDPLLEGMSSILGAGDTI